MNKEKITLQSIDRAAEKMDIENALAYIEEQSKTFAMDLEPIKEKYRKRYDAYIKERNRIEAMSVYEREGYARGLIRIGGIDEAGRGCFAGPVVAACVLLKKDTFIPYLDDSKKLSEKMRNRVFDDIIDKAMDYGIGMVGNTVIDDIGILNATKKAMIEAVSCMKIQPEHLLIDAVKLDLCHIPQTSIIKGDMLSVSIAAASILAKVTRDRHMRLYAATYPEYGFDKHKGYGTQVHRQAILKHGLCPLHRKTFLKKMFSR